MLVNRTLGLSFNQSPSLFYEKRITLFPWFDVWLRGWCVQVCSLMLWKDTLVKMAPGGVWMGKAQSTNTAGNSFLICHCIADFANVKRFLRASRKEVLCNHTENIRDTLGHWSLFPAGLLLTCLSCYFTKWFVPVDSVTLQIWTCFFFLKDTWKVMEKKPRCTEKCI